MTVKIKQRGQKLNSFEEIVEKAIDAEAKAPRPYFYACDTDQYYLWGSWPSEAKSSIQGQPMKDPRVKKSKPKTQEQKASAP